MLAIMSFIYIKNNTGPITDPCGTPLITWQGEEWLPLIITACCSSVESCNKDIDSTCGYYTRHHTLFADLHCVHLYGNTVKSLALS